MKKVKTSNVVLVIIGIMLLTYVVKMIQIFEMYGSTPDTLTMCVFALFTGECGILGWIKTAKVRTQERQWQQEDYEKMKAEQEKMRNQ
jgi:uncharacterized membrane protein